MSLSSTFDLKGIDTSKVGGNKSVDYTFKDYQKEFGLSPRGAKRDLKAKNIFLNDLEAIAPTIEGPTTVLGKVGQFLGTGPGITGETEIVDGKVVGKERPKGLLGIGRLTSGLADFATFGITDFDKRGGLLGGMHSGSGYGGRQDLDYKLPKVLTDSLAAADKAKKEKENFDPYADIDKLLDYELKYKKATDTMDRKGRAADLAMEMAAYRTQLPYITEQMKDLSTFKQRQLLDAEKIKQGLPNAQQSRLLAADTGFATQAGAIAGQQDAATRFAGLGMQRGFGQLS